MASEGEIVEIDREIVAARAELARARQTLLQIRYDGTAGRLRDAWEAERAAEERFRAARIRSYLAGVAPLASR